MRSCSVTAGFSALQKMMASLRSDCHCKRVSIRIFLVRFVHLDLTDCKYIIKYTDYVIAIKEKLLKKTMKKTDGSHNDHDDGNVAGGVRRCR